MNSKISIQELSENEQCISSDGTIQHLGSEYIYVLRSEGGLKQDIDVLEKGTLKIVKKINCKEQNFAALDSNSQHIAIVYSKGIVEIYDKSSWELLQTFNYPRNCMYIIMNEEFLLVSIYGSQSGLYRYAKIEKNWQLLGYPQIHTSPFLSACYHDGILYTGAMYEEINATIIKSEGFKSLGGIETWGRYVICLKVDQDNIYYGAEGVLGVYNKTTKETNVETFEDHTNSIFDIDEKYVYYVRGSNVAIKEKNSWNIVKEIVTEGKNINSVHVDDEFIYFNDMEKVIQIPKNSLF